MLVDDMDVRKEIWESHIKFNPQVPFMIEARMGTHHGQLFTINPMDYGDIELWEACWYPNDAVKEITTACGSTQTMCPTASIMAGYMAWQFVQAVKREPYQKQFTINLGEMPMVV